MIDEEEFLQWKSNPITRWVLDALMVEADGARDQFMQRFFYGDDTDAYAMGMSRGEFFGRMSMHSNELTYERLVELHDAAEKAEALQFTPSGWILKTGREQ